MKLKMLRDKEEILKAVRKKEKKKTNCRQRNCYLIYRRFHISEIDMGKQWNNIKVRENKCQP